MKLDTIKLTIDLKSLPLGINRGVFILPLDKVEWNIEDVEPLDNQGTLELTVDYRDDVILCSGWLDAHFRTPCARCLKPSSFSINEEICREYTWNHRSVFTQS